MKIPNVIIIECGTLPQNYEEKFGDYPQMFRELVAPHGINFEICRLVRGDFLPSPHAADGFLITGSRHGVYDELDWIEPLKDFIRACAKIKTPMVGICFGHQIMAEALGGKVIKSPKGWGLGPQDYIVEQQFAPAGAPPERMRVQAIHQDQVVEKPKDAEIFARSEFCQFAGLIYGKKPYAFSLQPHPEFDAEFVSELVGERRGESYPVNVADAALARMDEPLDRLDWGKTIADFFRGDSRD